MDSKPNGSKSRVKRLFNRYFDYKSWADWNRSRDITNYFISLFKKFFILQKKNKDDIKSFDEVMSELNLTEQDIELKIKSLRRMYRLMLSIAFIFYIYSMYHMLYGGFLAAMLSFVIMLVCVALAFRYHFWYFQIKRRKLGCSFKEWFRACLMGGD